MKAARIPLSLTAAAAALVLTGCSGSGSDTKSVAAASPATGAQRLSDVCPATVVVQMDWEPEAEHSGVYQLVGPGYTADSAKKRVTGPLVVAGKDTGVKIEIRAGGAAIGYQSVSAQMYVDKSITLGAVTTDSAVAASAGQPVTAVVSQLNKSPQMIMWDPRSHPGWTGVTDIGKTTAKVVVAKGSVYTQLLLDKGLIKPAQVDTGYDGSPARFATEPTIAQQGFATAEPYIYQHEVRAWNKPVKYQLLADVGYNVYPETLSVRTGDLSTLSPCLKKLVPILQQAQVDYINAPAATNKLITALVATYNDGWVYSAGVADYAATTMKQLGIVANDSSGPLGGMDMTRLQRAIDTFGPILGKTGAKIKPGLKAADIATVQFIDPGIKLG